MGVQLDIRCLSRASHPMLPRASCFAIMKRTLAFAKVASKMTTYRLPPIVLAAIIGASGGLAVAQAQPAATPPGVKTPIVRPLVVKPTPTKQYDSLPMTFFVATGEANTCGLGCERWIAADGKIDLNAAEHLRKLLAKLGRRRLPIFLHSGGGSVVGAIELGRLIRSRNIEVSVARTIPAE